MVFNETNFPLKTLLLPETYAEPIQQNIREEEQGVIYLVPKRKVQATQPKPPSTPKRPPSPMAIVVDEEAVHPSIPLGFDEEVESVTPPLPEERPKAGSAPPSTTQNSDSKDEKHTALTNSKRHETSPMSEDELEEVGEVIYGQRPNKDDDIEYHSISKETTPRRHLAFESPEPEEKEKESKEKKKEPEKDSARRRKETTQRKEKERSPTTTTTEKK